ncbi:MAG TPA: methyltransferase domain-containing protein [Chloroflexota bacterium]|nr:methyltransferase domain-containing protein [Chloroflexota bacterium]
MRTQQFDLHDDIEERHWWFRGRRDIILGLARTVAAPPGRVAMEIGCGTGGNLRALSTDYVVRGTDASADAVAVALSKVPSADVRLSADPAGDADWLAESSIVLILDVLEHIEDDAGFLARAVAGMRPGSHIVVAVPAGMHLWSPHDVAFGHYRRYDPTSLAALWRSLPVRERLLSYYNSRLYPIIRAVRLVSRARGSAVGRAGTDFSMYPGPINRVLERIFAGELQSLERAMAGRGKPYSRGASLIALLERTT